MATGTYNPCRHLRTEREGNHGARGARLPRFGERRAERARAPSRTGNTPLLQKATAARPPVNSPALAVVPAAAAGPATVPSLGQQLREVLPPRRLHSVSLCDHDANVLWLSEGALGPDEHGVIVEALEVLAADTSIPCHETALEDGRHALFLPVRAPSGKLVGIAMILADCKSVGDDTVESVTAAPVRATMQRLAVLMKPGAAHRAGDTHAGGTTTAAISVLELAAESILTPPPAASAARAGAAPPPIAATSIAPEQGDDILELAPAPRPPRPNGPRPADGDHGPAERCEPDTRSAAIREAARGWTNAPLSGRGAHLAPRGAARPWGTGWADPGAAVGMARRASHGVELAAHQLHRQP